METKFEILISVSFTKTKGFIISFCLLLVLEIVAISDCNSIYIFFVGYYTEMDMMKERFSKLLLGEDMSGSGKGVGTSMAISNAITNLCGTSLSQHVVQ